MTVAIAFTRIVVLDPQGQELIVYRHRPGGHHALVTEPRTRREYSKPWREVRGQLLGYRARGYRVRTKRHVSGARP